MSNKLKGLLWSAGFTIAVFVGIKFVAQKNPNTPVIGWLGRSI